MSPVTYSPVNTEASNAVRAGLHSPLGDRVLEVIQFKEGPAVSAQEFSHLKPQQLNRSDADKHCSGLLLSALTCSPLGQLGTAYSWASLTRKLRT